ncbi:MAG: cystathionine beta-synthase [Acidimicrobiales bacterium]
MPESGTEIHSSVLELIGNTPMVRLPRLSAALGLPTTLVMKMETTNPGGSAKDRPALAMIDAAEREGLLAPGGTIVEPTSGNTGIGLAIAAAQKGYRCVFVMTDKVAPEKVSLLRAYGADVVVCPVAVAPDDPASYYSTAKRLVQEIPGAYRPNQYDNPHNATAHYDSTGPEIWRQSAGRITHFVASMGTCGTITGVGRYLKEQNPNVRIIGADPMGSVFSGGSGRPYLVEGIGEDFFPAAFDRSLYDDIIAVSDADSFAMARRVTREEGIIVGGSGGTAVAAAVQVARNAGPEDLVVVLNPDSGRGYLSRLFDDGWMASFGFLQECEPCVQQLIDTRSDAVPDLLYVNPDHTVRHAIALMRKHEVSQLIVAKNEPPFATAEVSGAVDELHLMDAVFKNADVLERPIGEVMGPTLPTVGGGQSMDLLVNLLDSAPAVLVLSGGRPLCVLSRQDVLRFLSPVDG